MSTKSPTPKSDQYPTDAFEVHRQMVVSLFYAALLFCVILGVSVIFFQIKTLIVVAASGALGGFVSAIRRVYLFQRVFPKDFFKERKKPSGYLFIYSMVPPLVGAIAAVTLYLIFATEVIMGPMFPVFTLSESTPPITDDFYNFVRNWHPSSPADYAKVLVWGFVAGFLERFVPNLLESFASGAQKTANKETDKKTD